jgi:quercetin dioxygenase-like cupin family protein
VGYTVVDAADIPTVWGTFKFVRHALGARAFGLSQIDFPPDKVGSEHDESKSRQEEVYLTLAGAGTLEVDGETIEMKPGRYVLVSANSKRRPTAGPDGMSFLVIGGVPDGVYAPWSPPEE